MKKKGGIISNAYKWLSGLVTVGECVGFFSDNKYMCIGVTIVLIFSAIGGLAIGCNKVHKIKGQKERVQLRLEKRYISVKKELLEEELTETEREHRRGEEVNLLQEKAEAQKKYSIEEKEIIREIKKRLLTYGVVFIIVLLMNAEPIHTWAKGFISLIQNEAEQGTTGVVPREDGESTQVEDRTADSLEGEKDVQEGNDEADDLESNGVIVYGMTFYLDDSTLEWIPTPEMEEAVFYVDKDNIDIHDIVKQHMQNLIDKNLKDTYNGCLSPGEERLAASAADRETDFDDSREKVKQYAAEGNYAEWKKELKHSTYLDDIIKDRNELWKSGKQNSTLASLLANNNQDYALEYQNQGKSGYTILSYYLETIRWSELALSYEGADKNLIFDYTKARYWDIATCQAIPQTYRDNAEAIYLEMGEYEDYIK